MLVYVGYDGRFGYLDGNALLLNVICSRFEEWLVGLLVAVLQCAFRDSGSNMTRLD